MPAGNYLPMDPEMGGLHECVPFERGDAPLPTRGQQPAGCAGVKVPGACYADTRNSTIQATGGRHERKLLSIKESPGADGAWYCATEHDAASNGDTSLQVTTC